MGSYPQPLTIVSGKLYFVRGGSMVAVDLKDPTQRQTITEPGLSGLSIGWIDQEAVYCPLTTTRRNATGWLWTCRPAAG